MTHAIDLEAEYNNRARVPDHMEYFAAWHRDAAAYRSIARCDLDIAYGPGPRRCMDFFYPDQMTNAPTVLFIHGGYWQALDKSSASHLARGANKRGLAVAVPSYDLAPQSSLSEIVDCLEQAAAFVLERTQRPIVVVGHSAGGHLATCLMARSAGTARPIRAGMAISGLFDLVPLVSTTVNTALGLDVGEAARLSPIHWTPPQRSRLIAVVGGAESAEYHRQTRDMVASWNGRGAVARAELVAEAHHFNVIAGLTDPQNALVDNLVSLATEA